MKTAKKSLKLEPDLVAKIDEWCKANDRSFNWFMGKAAQDQLARESAGEYAAQDRRPLSRSAGAGAHAAKRIDKKCPDGKHCPVAVNS